MKFNIILISILVSVGFFNPMGILSEQIQKLMFYLCFLGGLGVALTSGVSLKQVRYPRLAYATVLVMILVSTVMASAFHSQSFAVSVMTMLPYISSYGFFYIFMKFDVPPKRIVNAYIVLCILSGFVYFANLLTFPNNIFGAPILGEDTTRGIIRLPVVFIETFPLLVFYSIGQWLETKRIKWLVLMSYAAVMIVLSVTRQIILVTALLGVFYLFKNISWPKKLALSLAMGAVILFVLPMIPMYNTMIELSETQREENEDEENIRIQSWRYYTYENQTNALTPILGNGMPSFGNSRWGQIFDSVTQENGCFAADVGWAGFFWYYGIFALVALAYMIGKAILKRKPPSEQYLTYWFIFIAITSFASGPILYYWQIFTVMLWLYVVYRPSQPLPTDVPSALDDSTNPETPTNPEASTNPETPTNPEASTNPETPTNPEAPTPKTSLFPRYPQL